MSTRHTTGPNANPQGSSIDPTYTLPPCTIEDVDRALFNLFDKDLALFYKTKSNTKPVPVIFATGERFAILRRKKPLRDKAGSIILPLISIMRSGIEQTPGKGGATNQTSNITIKKKLSPEDPSYQRLLNKEGLQHQDDRADSSHFNLAANGGTGANPGTVATRRPTTIPSSDVRSGKLIGTNKLGNNFYEIYIIPPPKYFTATYEVTFWTQYTQQMNSLLMNMMTSYHSLGANGFRIESDKGYYFVAYVDPALNSGNNFDDFSDNERIVKYSFNVQVQGYVVNPTYPGSPTAVRKYISAPQISFDMTQVSAIPHGMTVGGIRSGDPNDYILQNLNTADDPAVSRAVAKKGIIQGEKFYDTTGLGGASSGQSPLTVSRIYSDPVTGTRKKQKLHIKMRNQRKGETVYREQITYDLGQLIIEPT